MSNVTALCPCLLLCASVPLCENLPTSFDKDHGLPLNFLLARGGFFGGDMRKWALNSAHPARSNASASFLRAEGPTCDSPGRRPG